MMKTSLQKRLLFYVLGITTLFLLTISVINYWWAQDMVVDLSEKHASASADTAAARIHGYILQKGQNAWTLAQNEQIHEFVKKVSTQEVDLSTDATYKQMLTSFQRIVEENPDIQFVYIAVDKTQRLYGNIEFIYPVGYDVTKRPWYNMARQNKGISYTAPYICPLTGNYVVTACTAFYDSNGAFLGVAAVDILVNKISQIVSAVHLYDDDYAFLLDADGEIITNLKDDQYREAIMELETSEQQMRSTFSQMVAGQRGMNRVEMSDTEKYVLFSPVEDIGWSLGVVVPVDRVNSSIFDLAQIFFITLMIGITVIALLVSFLTDKITQPINTFTELMERVGDGDYSLRAPIESEDEIGQLGMSLNTMLNKQQSLIEQVIQTAYNMSMAGQELAISIGETRITLPMVTVNMGHIISSSESFNHLPEDQKITDNIYHDLTEQLILLMHTQRSISFRLKHIQLLLHSEDSIWDHDTQLEIMAALHETEDEFQQTSLYVENIQLGMTDLNAMVTRLAHNYEDMQYTLQRTSYNLGVLADLQSGSIDQATKTAGQLVEWSQKLIETSSVFRIKRL